MGQAELPLSKLEPEARATLLLFERMERFDKELSLRLHGRGVWVPRRVLRVLEYSGDGRFSIPLTASLWMAPVLLDLLELRSFLFNLFVAFLFDLAVIGLIKGLIRRPRPEYNQEMHVVVSVDHYSFPSGHSSRAVMIASLVWLYLPLWKSLLASQQSVWENWTTIVKIGFLPALETCYAFTVFTWALATAASRVLLGRHYVCDVIAGIVVGVLEAGFVHQILYVPNHVSEAIHRWLLGAFKVIGAD